eukprot:jgi/Hompol1/129/HPOL_002931-RA
MESLLDSAQECLEREDWLIAERYLAEFFIENNSSSSLLERALVLQAHMLTKTRLHQPRRSCSREAAETLESELALYFVELGPRSTIATEEQDAQDEFVSGLIPLKKILKLAAVSGEINSVRNAALTFLKLSQASDYRFIGPSIEFLRETIAGFEAVAKSSSITQLSDSDSMWQMILYLLLARMIVGEEIKEVPTKKGVEETKMCLIKASQIAANRPKVEYPFIQGFRTILALSPKIMELIEPKWSTIPIWKALSLLDHIKAAAAAASISSAPVPQHSLTASVLESCRDVIEASTKKQRDGSKPSDQAIILPERYIKLVLAREAIQHKLY